jgi:hypothetical protein
MPLFFIYLRHFLKQVFFHGIFIFIGLFAPIADLAWLPIKINYFRFKRLIS